MRRQTARSITIPTPPSTSHRIVVEDTLAVVNGAGELTLMLGFSESRGVAIGRTYTPGVLGLFGHGATGPTFFGREGDGPGEFRRPFFAAFGPGDTLVVAELGSVTFLTLIFGPSAALGFQPQV